MKTLIKEEDLKLVEAVSVVQELEADITADIEQTTRFEDVLKPAKDKKLFTATVEAKGTVIATDKFGVNHLIAKAEDITEVIESIYEEIIKEGDDVAYTKYIYLLKLFQEGFKLSLDDTPEADTEASDED